MAQPAKTKGSKTGCGCLTVLIVVAVIGIIAAIGGASKSKPLNTESAAMHYLINNLPGVDPFSSATWHGLCNQDADGWVCYTQQTGYSNDKSDRCQVLFICYPYPTKYWAMSKTGGNIRSISRAAYDQRAF